MSSHFDLRKYSVGLNEDTLGLFYGLNLSFFSRFLLLAIHKQVTHLSQYVERILNKIAINFNKTFLVKDSMHQEGSEYISF